MTLDEYQRTAFATARIHWDDRRGHHVPAFGALGELGSLVAEVKKSLRDGKAYTDVRRNMMEEFGDLLWYLAAIASHHDLSLEKLISGRATNRRNLANFAYVYSMVSSFASLVAALERLADHATEKNRRQLIAALADASQTTVAALRYENLKLDSVLQANLRKVRGMFGGGALRPARFFDRAFPPYEQLPRKLHVHFLERPQDSGRVEVMLRVVHLNIGDRLTDNARKDDGYRFHDAFHFAYCAVLGWSPVTRAMLRCKRKSIPKVDEVQDGARAVIIEEAIAHTVFNYARGHSMLKGLDRVDYGLLKLIQRMVRGLEVGKCQVFEWQRAILVGYEAFRSLQKNRGGWLTLDAEVQNLTYSREGPGGN